jgi:hypothetical protein
MEGMSMPQMQATMLWHLFPANSEQFSEQSWDRSPLSVRPFYTR